MDTANTTEAKTPSEAHAVTGNTAAAPASSGVILPESGAWPVYYRRCTVCGFLAPAVRDGVRAYRVWFEDHKRVPIQPFKDRKHAETWLRNSYHLRMGNP